MTTQSYSKKCILYLVHSGNTRGRDNKIKNWVNTDNTLVPKQKAQR